MTLIHKKYNFRKPLTKRDIARLFPKEEKAIPIGYKLITDQVRKKLVCKHESLGIIRQELAGTLGLEPNGVVLHNIEIGKTTRVKIAVFEKILAFIAGEYDNQFVIAKATSVEIKSLKDGLSLLELPAPLQKAIRIYQRGSRRHDPLMKELLAEIDKTCQAILEKMSGRKIEDYG